MVHFRLSFALYQQNYSTDGQDGPGKWTVWDIVGRFLRGVNWPYIQNLVASFESESAPNDDSDANHNQQDCRCFH